mmetsp:Transcript_63313/g.182090  ORF Transcript_63313/g.182090 Transcript_63313/m.182090 type:complete len:234 (+) Transcript_63313:548-1249(+)
MMSLLRSSTSHNVLEFSFNQASKPANWGSVFQFTSFDLACMRTRYALSKESPRFAPSTFSSTEMTRKPPQNCFRRPSSHNLSSRVAAPRFFRCAVLGNLSLEPFVKNIASKSSSPASFAKSSAPGNNFSAMLRFSRHFSAALANHFRNATLFSPMSVAEAPARRASSCWIAECPSEYRFNAIDAIALHRRPTKFLVSIASNRLAASATSRDRCARPQATQRASRATNKPSASP